MVNFSSRISDCDSRSSALLNLFLFSVPSIHYTVAFSPLRNSDHVLVSVSIEFHLNSKGSERSSRPEVFCKKGVFRNFAKFTGKHLYQSLFFNKVVGLRPATLLKKRLWHGCFPVNFAKFLRTPFLKEHLWWLLLKWSFSSYSFWLLKCSLGRSLWSLERCSMGSYLETRCFWWLVDPCSNWCIYLSSHISGPALFISMVFSYLWCCHSS